VQGENTTSQGKSNEFLIHKVFKNNTEIIYFAPKRKPAAFYQNILLF
jgi:hypothetical protein